MHSSPTYKGRGILHGRLMKLKYKVIAKFTMMTNKEIALLMLAAQYQDEHGHVKGLHHKYACQGGTMCKQTFYNVLRSLAAKGVISYKHNVLTGDYDIIILDNDFSYPSSYQEGYVNLNRKVFSSPGFKKLRAKEKALLLLLLQRTHENRSSYQIGTKKFYEKYMALLGVTKHVLRGYLHSLKKFFSIGVKDGKYFITFLWRVFGERRAESEVDQYLGYIVRTGCRRNKVIVDSDTEVKDVAQLLKQYRQAAREAGRDIIDILDDSLAVCKKLLLNGKYIHKLIRQELGIEYRLTRPL